MPHRPKVIIGNWKMNKTIAEAKSFISGLALAAKQSAFQIGLAVPFTMIDAAAETARGTVIRIGAQDVADREEGPYTGEVSAKMIVDAGASFVLVGHSERRRCFHEDDAMVNRKIQGVLKVGIQPVCCIGETQEERQSGQAYSVLRRQLLQGLHGLSKEAIASLSIAYEPVWAIGTSQVATPEIAQETHAFCRSVIADTWGKEAADRLIIQYGGSVNPTNAAALLAQSDIDGLLVGNASLSLEAFTSIVLTHM